MAGTFEPAGTSMKPISRTPLQDLIHHFMGNKTAVAGLIVCIILSVAAFTGWFFTMATEPSVPIFDPNATETKAQLLPPFSTSYVPMVENGVETIKSTFHLLGTDDLGRDVLLRLWSGSFYSLLVGFVVVGISAVIGILVGGIAGYYGKGKARLPFLLTVVGPPLAMLVATFKFLGDMALVLSIVVWVVTAAAFALQVYTACLAERRQSLGWLAAAALLAAAVWGYPMLKASGSDAGAAMYAAEAALTVGDETIEAANTTVGFARAYENLNDLKVTAEREGKPFTQDTELKQAEEAYRRALQDFNISKATYSLAMAEAASAKAAAALSANIDEIARTEAGDTEIPAESRPTALEGMRASQAGLKTTVEKTSAALEEAKQALTTAQAKAGTPVEGALQSSRDLRLFKSQTVRVNDGGYTNTIKEAIEAMGKDDWLFRTFRGVYLRITTAFLLALAFLAFAQTAQDGARHSPVYRAFVPIMTIDNFVMRAIEIFGSVPRLFLLLTVLAFYEKDVITVMFVLGVTSWMGTARFIRAEILSLRERDFIQASRALGLRDFRIVLRHLVPNALSPVLVSMTIGVATAIIFESTLSFLGLGAGTDQVTWGKMLSDGRMYLTSAAWLSVVPGVAIFIVVLAFNLLGEGLREAMNPKLRKR